MKNTLNRNELKAVNAKLKEMNFTSKATQKNTTVTMEDHYTGEFAATVTFPHMSVFVTMKNEKVVSASV